MHLKINNAQVVNATMTLPIAGPWTAIVEADSGEAVDAQATLTIADTLTFRGTSARSGASLGRARARVVGGGGGFRLPVAGFAYYEAPLSVIVGDLLTAVGETLSPLSDAAMLATVPRHWLRAKGAARDELDVLADRFGFAWRVLPNGETWLGFETWPTSPLSLYTVLEDAREDGRAEIAAEVPMVLPGETFMDRHVVGVVHTLDGHQLRTTVNFE